MTGRRRARGFGLATVAVLVVLGTITAACSGGDDRDEGAGTSPPAPTSTGAAEPSTAPPGITPTEAIEIARAEWREIDPSFDVAATRPEVTPANGTYDVALVPLEIEGPGGEPHVVVDATTGEVLDAYQTL